ncbi:hypothetical protein BB561_006857 [Smittium simulii]|uniref:Uncharacterized protein n=1 Tax=Smittium simulii TaxID=133385 RepID=A0A2T9Y0U4_9FUNG|nr:hypothetical protein BB561_006857 [Smittium simulii]
MKYNKDVNILPIAEKNNKLVDWLLWSAKKPWEWMLPKQHCSTKFKNAILVSITPEDVNTGTNKSTNDKLSMGNATMENIMKHDQKLLEAVKLPIKNSIKHIALDVAMNRC